MMVSALDIVNTLDGKFPQEEVRISNISDVHLGSEFGFVYQYIFGLAAQDPGGSFEHYKTWVRDQLKPNSAGIEFMNWPFEDYEIADAETVIGDLASHYGVKLDFARMSRDLGVKRPEGRRYFLVVSINRIPFPLAS